MEKREGNISNKVDMPVVHTVAQLKGHRLRMVRALSGLSRQEFQDKIGFSASMLSVWETGRIELTEKNAVRLSNALRLAGISCSSEWLLSGTSTPPRVMDIVEKTIFASNAEVPFQSIGAESETDRVFASLSEDIRKELNFFLTIHRNSVFHILSSDFDNHRYGAGDCVAGIAEEAADISGKIAIGIAESGGTVLGRVINSAEHKFEICTDDHNTRTVIVPRAAKVTWHRVHDA